MDNYIEWIENWYKQNCDGVWEHFYGIKIETLDNPGWGLKVDLDETQYSDMKMKKISVDYGKDDWYTCSIEDNCFFGYGDSSKLREIIKIFRECVENYCLSN